MIPGLLHPPLNPCRELPRIYDVCLEDHQLSSWDKFKVLGVEAPIPCGQDDDILEKHQFCIELDHPFAIIVCEFAVASFNKVCQMEFKRGVANNLHHVEFMDCKYMNADKHYYFYVTIEAIEEGSLGVYEAKVLCDADDGSRTLSKFVLTNRTPVGKKAMEISRLSRLTSIYRSMKGLKKDLDLQLGTRHRSLKGMKKATVVSELIHLKICHIKARKGLRKMLYRDIQSTFPPDCIQTTNPDDWMEAQDDFYSGMVRRNGGYDYYNPLAVSGFSTIW